LHREPSNIFEVTHSSNAKKRAVKIEIRKKYLPNYVRYSDKPAHELPGSERPCTKFCSKTAL
jgi:hypothetical protein